MREIEQLKQERDEAQECLRLELAENLLLFDKLGLKSADDFGNDTSTAALSKRISLIVKERDEAQAKCAEMSAALESALAGVWDGHYSGKGVTVDYARAVDSEVKHALSSDCGKGWRSPEQFAKELEPTLRVLNDYWNCADDTEYADRIRSEIARLESVLKGGK